MPLVRSHWLETSDWAGALSGSINVKEWCPIDGVEFEVVQYDGDYDQIALVALTHWKSTIRREMSGLNVAFFASGSHTRVMQAVRAHAKKHNVLSHVVPLLGQESPVAGNMTDSSAIEALALRARQNNYHRKVFVAGASAAPGVNLAVTTIVALGGMKVVFFDTKTGTVVLGFLPRAPLSLIDQETARCRIPSTLSPVRIYMHRSWEQLARM